MLHDLVGVPVRYVPHAEHEHLADHAVLAAIVGRDHGDGTLDLMVFVPNKEPHWQDAVPAGTGPHSWHHLGAMHVEEPPGAIEAQPEAQLAPAQGGEAQPEPAQGGETQAPQPAA